MKFGAMAKVNFSARSSSLISRKMALRFSGSRVVAASSTNLLNRSEQ